MQINLITNLNQILAKKNVSCFICGKLSHYALQCRKWAKSNNPYKLSAKLVEEDEIIVVVISKINLVCNVKEWVIESSVIKHICVDSYVFIPYLQVGNEKELVFIKDS